MERQSLSKLFLSRTAIKDIMMKRVKKCPECGSKSVTFWMGASAGIMYYCKKCKYKGPLVVEEDVEG